MKRKRKLFFVFACILCIVLLGGVGYDAYTRHQFREASISVDADIDSQNESDLTAEEDTEEPEIQDEQEAIINTNQESNFPEPESLEPLITHPVIPQNVYVLPGEEGRIKCCYLNAEEYIWEYYKESEKDWMPISDNPNVHLTGETDEFNRSISTLIIKGDENNGLLTRCRVLLPEEEEEKIYQASYNILSFTADEIKGISIPETSNAEAGTYISTQDIPVTITLNDDSTETVTGLSSLFFCAPKDVSREAERNGDGTTIETVKTTTLESEYRLIDAGENKMLLRYRGTEPGIDVEANIEGTDSLPPEVAIALSDYTVSNVESDGVAITATITATDNYSPLTKLLYAFVPKGQKIVEDNFDNRSNREVEVKENGTWTAYVKDEVGNIGSEDIEIIIVDQKAPVIESVSLKNQGDGWYKENKIIVSASDKTAIKYQYICEKYNMDSGWIDSDEYDISQNGIWKVKVKDVAGNESEKEITVTNVDSMPPIILSVVPKEKEVVAQATNIGPLEDRVSVTVNGANVQDSNSNTDRVAESSNTINYSTTPTTQFLPNTNGYGIGGTNTPVKGEKGERGEKGEAGSVGISGKDGISYYMHVKYAENAAGTNMSDAPNDSSKYIGVYTGTSSYPPSSSSSYKWSQYKGTSSQLFIRYSDDASGANMTDTPTETSSYIGICNATEITAPNDPQNYTWSIYKDNTAISELQEQIKNLQKQIDEMKTP